MRDFGSNPGRLRALTYMPEQRSPAAPLVVVLHGGSQSARDYDRGSGWSQLADRLGFAVLLPEQHWTNNAMLCFNWYEAADNRRSVGEALSISQMIEALVVAHDLDRRRIYITGLSAGGAMAAVMLATYPEVFAGGAMIAGVAYGSASDAFQAMDRMHGLGGPTAAHLAATVRAASTHTGPWPILSIWHGTADRTVNISNVETIAGQWRLLLGLPLQPTRCDVATDHLRRVWCDADGRELLETHEIKGMGHGTPLDTRGTDGFGVSGPFMLEAQIGSTLRIARFWRIAPPAAIAQVADQVADRVAADVSAPTDPQACKAARFTPARRLSKHPVSPA